MTEPVPYYKQGRFIFAGGTILVCAGLLCLAYITDVQFVDILKFIGGAYLGGPAS